MRNQKKNSDQIQCDQAIQSVALETLETHRCVMRQLSSKFGTEI